MPRARNIKPAFFKNEELAEVGFAFRLLFVGLWTLADREGRLEDRPKRIKMEIFPADDVDVDAGLAELAARGFLRRYDAEGKRAIQIVNFVLHQQPHYKEVASEIAPPPGHVDSAYVAFGVPADQRRRILDRDDHRCSACSAADDLTMDHIVARSKGGTGDDDNLRTLCRRCNSSKNNRDHASTSAQDRPKIDPSKTLHDPLNPESGILNPDVLTPDVLNADTGLRMPDMPGADAPADAAAPDRLAKPPAYPADFEVFWREYPKGRGAKAPTFEAWRRLKLTAETKAEVLAGLARWKACEMWEDPTMVVYADRWLKEHRWGDDPPPPKPRAAAKSDDPIAYFSAMGRGEI